jgi:ATP-dependent RNA helicase DDX23/PRP28
MGIGRNPNAPSLGGRNAPPSIDALRAAAAARGTITGGATTRVNEEDAKPKFMTKEERAAAALKRREEEVAAQKARAEAQMAGARAFENAASTSAGVQRGGGGGGGGPTSRFRREQQQQQRGGRGGGSGRRDRDRGRGSGRRDHVDDERKRQRDEELERERELEQLKAQYMGGEEKKKKQRAKKGGKFVFDWAKDEDTSRDLNPLYDRPHEVAPMFGRGMLAGVDRREQSRVNSERERSLIVQSRKDLGSTDVHADARKFDKERERRRKEAEEREFKKTFKEHWSDKALANMTERDWRIFREDFNISYKGGRLPMPMRSWEECPGLPNEILRAIQKVGYAKPSPIQMASIPIGLLKRDVIGIAETGSGKTCAFVVPMLAHIMQLPKMTDEVAAHGPYALVMAPTRELAQQIEEETLKFAHFLDYRVGLVVGGQSIEDQGFKLRRGVEILVGTPGRIIDVIDRRYTVLNQCNYIVLDEADRMIDMGFEPQVNAVMEAMGSGNLKPEDQAEELDARALDTVGGAGIVTSKYRTTYMFSATMPPSVERLARSYLRNPAVVTIGSAGKTSDLIKQEVIWVSKAERDSKLEFVLSCHPNTQAIIFVNAKRSVDAVANLCYRLGYSCASIHGGKSQDQREEALRGFKAGKFDILVATDVAGRGIDVKGIDLVVNYELPKLIENYTHRIGRTGRAGRKGTAVSFLTSDDRDIMYELKELLINSKNVVPDALANHEAARVKPQRDERGQRMSREDIRGQEAIIF